MAPAAPAASYARLVILVAATSLLAGAGLAGMLYGGTFFGEGPCSVYDAASPQHAFCALARRQPPHRADLRRRAAAGGDARHRRPDEPADVGGARLVLAARPRAAVAREPARRQADGDRVRDGLARRIDPGGPRRPSKSTPRCPSPPPARLSHAAHDPQVDECLLPWCNGRLEKENALKPFKYAGEKASRL